MNVKALCAAGASSCPVGVERNWQQPQPGTVGTASPVPKAPSACQTANRQQKRPTNNRAALDRTTATEREFM